MLEEKQRFDSLRKLLENSSFENIRKLNVAYCEEVAPEDIPITRMCEWQAYCEQGKINPREIDCFRSWDVFFYKHKGTINTEECLEFAIDNDVFHDIIRHYSLNWDSYKYASAILTGERYIFVTPTADFRI